MRVRLAARSHSYFVREAGANGTPAKVPRAQYSSEEGEDDSDDEEGMDSTSSSGDE